MAQDEPFDELLGRRIADRFLYDGRFASFGLAHQIDRLLNRRKVAGQRRGRRSRSRCIDGRCLLTPRRRYMHRMSVFLKRGVALMAHPGRRIRLPGMLNLLVAGERYRIIRKRAEQGEREEASHRPEGFVHSVIPRELTRHEHPRSVPLELHRRYHTA